MNDARQVTFRDYFSPFASWRAQPRWSRTLFLVVGVPAILVFGTYVFFVSDSTGFPLWAAIAFGAFLCVVAIMQVNLVRVLFRGHW